MLVLLIELTVGDVSLYKSADVCYALTCLFHCLSGHRLKWGREKETHDQNQNKLTVKQALF